MVADEAAQSSATKTDTPEGAPDGDARSDDVVADT